MIKIGDYVATLMNETSRYKQSYMIKAEVIDTFQNEVNKTMYKVKNVKGGNTITRAKDEIIKACKR